jgi:hypothetical protein
LRPFDIPIPKNSEAETFQLEASEAEMMLIMISVVKIFLIILNPKKIVMQIPIKILTAFSTFVCPRSHFSTGAKAESVIH